jgi:hypothetical protein
MKSANFQPPVIAVWLIDLFLPEEKKGSVKGDLLEESSDLATKLGESSARSWYWRQSVRTVARLGVRGSPWLIALALLSGLIVLTSFVDLFMGHKSLQLAADNQNLQIRSIDRFISWLVFGLVMFDTSVAGWVLVMIAKAKELISSILLALVLVLSGAAAHALASLSHLRPLPPSQPALLMLQALLIVMVGIAVRQIRLSNSRRRTGG